MGQQGTRNRLIDLARAFAIVNMVIFHYCFDYFVVYGNSSDWYSRLDVHLWQQLICWTFILVSGVAWNFSRSNFKKGLVLNLCGLVVTAVTVLALPSEAVYFGILNFLGCAAWLLVLLEPMLKKCPPLSGLALSFSLFAFTYRLQTGVVGWGSFSFGLPKAFYQGKPMVVLGFPYAGFSSSDYFPLMPWFFLFLCGYFLWQWPVFQKTSARVPVFSTRFLSQKSLWIYMLHQPLCMGLAYLAEAFL